MPGTRCASGRRSSGSSNEDRAGSGGHGHRAAGACATRTPSCAGRRSSPSRTAWAARVRARSRRELAATALEEARERDAGRGPSVVGARSRRPTAGSGSARWPIPETTGMGAVATVGARRRTAHGTVAIGHVGDSRAYLLRDGAHRAADDGSLARRRARGERRAHARGGRAPSAALGDHAGARDRAVGRGRRRSRSTGSPAISSSSARTGSPSMVADDGRGRRRSRRRGATPLVPPRRSSRRRTRAAARTTSPSCCSSSSRRARPKWSPPTRRRWRKRPSPRSEPRLGTDAGPTQTVPPRRRPGGRIAALALLAALVAVGLLALYWGITR